MTFKEMMDAKAALESERPRIVRGLGDRVGVRIGNLTGELTIVSVNQQISDLDFRPVYYYDGVPEADGIPNNDIFRFTEQNVEYYFDGGNRVNVIHHVGEDSPEPEPTPSAPDSHLTDQQILQAINGKTEDEEYDDE